MKALRKAHNKPIIAVITGGSAVDVSAIQSYSDAIIYAWYPGEQGGNALADILFGKVSPSGHLPVTFYQAFSDLPEYDNYNMKGRTYRYYNGKLQYPFGFGLSYTKFGYSWVTAPANAYTGKDNIRLKLSINNNGNYDGNELVQVYIKYPDVERMPLKELKAFKKVFIPKGNSREIELSIPVNDLQKWDPATHGWKLYPGKYELLISKNAEEPVLQKEFMIQ